MELPFIAVILKILLVNYDICLSGLNKFGFGIRFFFSIIQVVEVIFCVSYQYYTLCLPVLCHVLVTQQNIQKRKTAKTYPVV